jgi:hypothetical protein
MAMTVVLLIMMMVMVMATSQAAGCSHDPDYDSGWNPLSSQQGKASFQEYYHGLPDYPGHVMVYVQIISGPNAGMCVFFFSFF